MAKMFVAILASFASVAMADTTILSCSVPSEAATPAVTLNVDLAADQSIDFLTIYVNEASSNSIFFSQMDKGAVAEQLKQGYLNMLVLTEQTGQVDGVITNSGFFAVFKEDATTYSGFLAANGNVYPLACKGN